MKNDSLIALIALGLFVYVEFFRVQTPTVAIVANNPGNANALGTPTAGINPSTLTPMQLGSGLFENQSGLQTSPGVFNDAT